MLDSSVLFRSFFYHLAKRSHVGSLSLNWWGTLLEKHFFPIQETFVLSELENYKPAMVISEQCRLPEANLSQFLDNWRDEDMGINYTFCSPVRHCAYKFLMVSSTQLFSEVCRTLKNTVTLYPWWTCIWRRSTLQGLLLRNCRVLMLEILSYLL